MRIWKKYAMGKMNLTNMMAQMNMKNTTLNLTGTKKTNKSGRNWRMKTTWKKTGRTRTTHPPFYHLRQPMLNWDHVLNITITP